MKRKQEKNKSLIATILIVLTIALLGSSTYAYWKWTTANNQQIDVELTIKGGSLTISGSNVSSNFMLPTDDCDGTSALVSEEATIVAKNETKTNMQVTIKLRGTLSSNQGTLSNGSNGNKRHLKWAIIETTNETTKTCDNPDYSGTLDNVSIDTDIDTGITFMAYKNDLTTNELSNFPETTISNGVSTTTRKYKLYVWLDREYEWINTGNTISDPMQDLTLNIKWSPGSTLEQVY